MVVVVLVKLGFDVDSTAQKWRPYMIVGAFAVSALVTPPDAVSMLLLAIPLVCLYEVVFGRRVCCAQRCDRCGINQLN